MAKMGLSMTEFSVLNTLHHRGPTPLGELSDRILLTGASADAITIDQDDSDHDPLSHREYVHRSSGLPRRLAIPQKLGRHKVQPSPRWTLPQEGARKEVFIDQCSAEVTGELKVGLLLYL